MTERGQKRTRPGTKDRLKKCQDIGFLDKKTAAASQGERCCNEMGLILL